MNFDNYLKSFYCKKQQKPGVLGGIACLYANGKGRVERKNLMVEERRLNFWNKVLDWAWRGVQGLLPSGRVDLS